MLKLLSMITIGLWSNICLTLEQKNINLKLKSYLQPLQIFWNYYLQCFFFLYLSWEFKFFFFYSLFHLSLFKWKHWSNRIPRQWEWLYMTDCTRLKCVPWFEMLEQQSFKVLQTDLFHLEFLRGWLVCSLYS